MQLDLLDYVVSNLREYEGSLTELAREAGVKASWLGMFKRGAIPNPGIQQIQRLAAYFEARAARGSNGASTQQAAGQPRRGQMS